MANPIKSLSELYIYPVKSCKGIRTAEVRVGKKGPDMDRRWMVINQEGRFISQRNYPKMALIEVQVVDRTLILSYPGKPPLAVPLLEQGIPIQATVWRDTCAAIDQGEAAASYFSEILDVECKLVFMPDSTIRQVDQKYSHNPQDDVSFADGFPFLLISSASLDDLNQRLDQPLPMNRFRPNLVVSNSIPYEEDSWKKIRIGQLIFDVVKPCSRCVITTINQQSAEKGLEPLQTLATYRKKEKGIMFGQNLIHQNQGVLHEGDLVEILE